MPEKRFDDIDAGRAIDWGRTSADYDRYRPGPPESFYEKLVALGVGHPAQRLLDLGTGTGLVARRMAASGLDVCGIDISADQIRMAELAAARDRVQARFQVAAAESIPYPAGSFDAVSANQCWMYFELPKVVPEVIRVLQPDGRLLISHFSFMPRLDPVVRASEALVLKYNPDWSGADWDGHIPAVPGWSREAFDLVGLFVYDQQIPFTRESWRGRMRALRGIAASLSSDQVAAFDAEHDVLLRALTTDEFPIWHRIHAQIFTPRPVRRLTNQDESPGLQILS